MRVKGCTIGRRPLLGRWTVVALLALLWPTAAFAAPPAHPLSRTCPPPAGYLPAGLAAPADVEIEVLINRRGDVERTRVVRSSGLADVDRAATALTAACRYERPGPGRVSIVESVRFEPED